MFFNEVDGFGRGGGGRKQRIFWGFGSRLVENGRQSSGPFNLMRIVLPGEASVLPEKLHAGAMKNRGGWLSLISNFERFHRTKLRDGNYEVERTKWTWGGKEEAKFFCSVAHEPPPSTNPNNESIPSQSLNVVGTKVAEVLGWGGFLEFFWRFVAGLWRRRTSSSRLAVRKAMRGWGR